MNISRNRNRWAVFAYGSLACGLCGISLRVDAQNVAAPAGRQPASVAAATAPDGNGVAGEELLKRVTAALHTAPYFYDRHVTVSIEGDSVVLRGFVFSDWDLIEALRIAKKAAGDRSVIDDLSIKEGGSR